MIFNKLKVMLSESTAFGLPNIFKRERIFNKLFWIIFVLLGTVSSVYFTIEAINDYFNYEIITKIESVYEQPLKFPTITICDDGTKSNETVENEEYFNNKKPWHVISKCYNLHDLLNCTNNPNNFFEIIHFSDTKDYGNCWTFNSGKNMKNETIPFLYSTIGGRDDFIQIGFKSSLRLKIFLHDVDLPPTIQYWNIHESEILINFNLSYYIVIEKTQDNKLGLPYNNCYKDVSEFDLNKTLIDYIKSLNQRYTQVNCLKLCFELDYIEKNPCNCSNTTLGNVWSDCFVGLEKHDENLCTMKYKRNFTKNSVVENCAKYCPLECDSTIYTYSMSTGQPANESTTTTTFRVFYNSLKVATISQKPKTQLFDLVSNIGGIFGLFIGLSFVSLFEIGEIFIEILISILFRNSVSAVS